ncbi:MAG: tyrosine-type recombinase/integrase [Chloroflexi bacterium]|nr:tyrosine-type recombinase/integrase [Chloroflexota bacterium]
MPEPTAEQPSLIPQQGTQAEYGQPLTGTGPLTYQSSLAAAMGAFHDHMKRKGFSENTIKAFMGDLRILSRYLGADRPVGRISTEDLNNFLAYLLYQRGKPCSPKSFARRLTTLKVFFGWLVESQVLADDPAAPIAHQPVRTPLPEILFDDEVDQLMRTAQDLLWAPRPDARPYVLVSLLLQTGIKKSECMNLRLDDIDLSNPAAPSILIRYDNPRMVHKERRLSLSPYIIPALRQYLAEYQPKTHLFECTARNLEYVLADLGQKAGLTKPVGFEMLRWTCAVRDFRNGMPEERLRKKLGLSPISWRETSEKIRKLASPGL